MVREVSDRADPNGVFIGVLVGVCSGYALEIVGIRGRRTRSEWMPKHWRTGKIERTRRTFDEVRDQGSDVVYFDVCIKVDGCNHQRKRLWLQTTYAFESCRYLGLTLPRIFRQN